MQQGLEFRGNAAFVSSYFLASPVIAFAAAALAWRNSYPVLAAFIVTAPTFASILLVIAFAVIIAMYGF